MSQDAIHAESFAGYIADGRLTADVQRLRMARRRPLIGAALPAEFLARLPPAERTALQAMATLLAAGEFPALEEMAVEPISWALDFAARGLRALDAEQRDVRADVLGLAENPDGDRWCVLAQGGLWPCRRAGALLDFEDGFASLDEALFALVHRQAIAENSSLYQGELRALFNRKAGAEQQSGWTRLHDDILEQLEDEDDEDDDD